LPTEWWRETVERRQRYQDLRTKMSGGEVQNINDLITLNLDIRLFAQDALRLNDDPPFIRHFFAALERLSVLDPTCGSGAFLFAALNILEPLYEICLDQMADFTATRPGKFKDFEKTLADANDRERHPNRDYFIYKCIIVQNLYGVDIMREAVEIAKLRLFLKLMSTVEADRLRPNLGLEPLPDVDFNLRSGNSLVGFATFGEAEEAIRKRDTAHGQTVLVFDTDLEVLSAVREKAELVARAFARFQDGQVVTDQGSDAHQNAKNELRKRLSDLNDALNTYNAFLYGIDREKKKADFEHWLEKHQPFHWFAEFYEIVNDRGGFDCVIGNPPYVELKEVKAYSVIKFETVQSGDLYNLIMERSVRLGCKSGRLGFIIPMSCFSVDGFETTQSFLKRNSELIFVSNWSGDAHPAKLFEGVQKRLHIVLFKRGGGDNLTKYTTKYIKWYSEERDNLFSINPKYFQVDEPKIFFFQNAIPKIGSDIERSIISTLKNAKGTVLSKMSKFGATNLFYTRKVSFFLQFLDFIPEVRDHNGVKIEPSELKKIYFQNENDKILCLASLSSSLFYWYYIVNSDCRNLNKREIENFRIGSYTDTKTLSKLLKSLMNSYQDNSTLRTIEYQGKGELTVQYFNFRPSKPIIDAIDTLLASHYGFTPEELDFIINYDIKYRMGRGSGEEA
jgi:hypothetical protein